MIRVADLDPGVWSDPGFKMSSDPDPAFMMRSDPDPVLKIRSDPDLASS